MGLAAISAGAAWCSTGPSTSATGSFRAPRMQLMITVHANDTPATARPRLAFRLHPCVEWQHIQSVVLERER
jgi:hypothetical protein